MRHPPPALLFLLLAACSTPSTITAEPAPTVAALPVAVDLTTCYTAGLSAGQVTACVQGALDTAVDNACAGGGCCLSRESWVTTLDHGIAPLQTGATARKLLWIQVRRKRPGELNTVWEARSLSGYADLPSAIAGTVATMLPPDCQGGSDGGYCPSRYVQVPAFAPQIGAATVLLVGWRDAAHRGP